MAGNKISNSLVVLSSAAVLAVYAAGFHRTSAAAERFATQSERRAPVPIAEKFVAPSEALRSADSMPAVLPVPAEKTETIPVPATASDNRNSVRVPAEGPSTVSAVTPVAAADASLPTPLAAPIVAPIVAPVVTSAPIAASTVAAPPPPAPAVARGPYQDGTFTGWGSSRHGDIEAQVVIVGGHIANASIAQCLTRYPCSWISHAPGQVVARQSPNIDYVSGATQSVRAFQDAIAEALSKAR